MNREQCCSLFLIKLKSDFRPVLAAQVEFEAPLHEFARSIKSVQVAMADRAAALSAYVQVGDGRRVRRRRRGAIRGWEVGVKTWLVGQGFSTSSMQQRLLLSALVGPVLLGLPNAYGYPPRHQCGSPTRHSPRSVPQLQAKGDLDGKKVRLAKLRGTPGLKEEKISEAEREVVEAEQKVRKLRGSWVEGAGLWAEGGV